MKKLLLLLGILFIASKAYGAGLEIDNMEYVTNATARAAYPGVELTYLPVLDVDHVKSTSELASYLPPYAATNTSAPLIGAWGWAAWVAPGAGSQRFHIDANSNDNVVNQIYYENSHYEGTDHFATGIRNFTFWGSNSSDSFNETTFGNDTGWTQIGGAFAMQIHVSANIPDPRYIDFANSAAYRYYALNISSNWGSGDYTGLRRIKLNYIDSSLLSYTNQTAVQGNFSLEGVAAATTSADKSFIHVFDSAHAVDLGGVANVGVGIMSNRTGENLQLSLSSKSEFIPPIDSNHVKATTSLGVDSYAAWNAFNTSRPLIGAWTNGWLSGYTVPNRVHVDLVTPEVITKIYYESTHDYGVTSNAGARNFTFWGSNFDESFQNVTYEADAGWTQVDGNFTFDAHSAVDAPDPKYIYVSNTVPYRYYAIKISSNYGGEFSSLRRLVLMRNATSMNITPTIAAADTWQNITWDVSGLAYGDRQINNFTITVVNATEANDFHIDNLTIAQGGGSTTVVSDIFGIVE